MIVGIVKAEVARSAPQDRGAAMEAVPERALRLRLDLGFLGRESALGERGEAKRRLSR
jgi:hypothetical protein